MNYAFLGIVLIFILSIFIDEMVEAHVLFNKRDVISIVFWYYLGSISYLYLKRRINMKTAFIAWTPLHLINILNVYQNFYRESKGDLFIYSEFENARRYSERIKELGLFNDVVFVNHRKIGSSFKRKINLLTNHNQFFSDDLSVYDEIFIQGKIISQKYFSPMFTKNPDVKLNYIEDGLGTYLKKSIFSTSKNVQRVFKILNKNSIFKKN